LNAPENEKVHFSLLGTEREREREREWLGDRLERERERLG